MYFSLPLHHRIATLRVQLLGNCSLRISAPLLCKRPCSANCAPVMPDGLPPEATAAQRAQTSSAERVLARLAPFACRLAAALVAPTLGWRPNTW